jgi:hypothetical protein
MRTERESFAGGDPGWIRTSDLQLRRLLLYPLSYGAILVRCLDRCATQPQTQNTPRRNAVVAGRSRMYPTSVERLR